MKTPIAAAKRSGPAKAGSAAVRNFSAREHSVPHQQVMQHHQGKAADFAAEPKA